jgi:thiol-disulfide isomerase/thioredoxin
VNGHYRIELNIQSPEFFNFHIDGKHFTFMILEGDTIEMNFDKLRIQETVRIQENNDRTNSELVALSCGAQAPDFSFKDPSGRTIKLSDFAGKYVCIDVWNSACGPCFKEFPVMEELVERYSNRKIEFVGISLDSNEKRWKKTLEKRDLKGIQLFGGGWDSEFVKDYHIWYNPRFILVDRDQRIVYLSAPRPTGNIDEIIGSLPGL